jgi:argininosuccinate lyase
MPQKINPDVLELIRGKTGRVVGNLKRKQADAERMAVGMIEHMSEITKADLRATGRTEVAYNPTVRMTVPAWLRSEVA